MSSRLVLRAVRRGFSLVELLVVIAILGIILGLILPAVMSAREAGRRAECLSNLRQLGVALHAYHGVWNRFPPGAVEIRYAPSQTHLRQLAWSALLLDYLEQRPLYAQLDLSQPFDSAANAQAAAAIVPVYLCPSTPRQAYRIDGRAVTDYGGIYGERITAPLRTATQRAGTMRYDESTSINMIVDGLSATLIVAEDSRFTDAQWINGRNVFDQAYAINDETPYFENEIRSEHPSGADALLSDGSARFLPEQIDLDVLAALCTRAGEELVDDW